ncbi:MAG: hypothetical protein SPE82_05335 [Succinivibrio sp.]|nr:hypothetical protein [Succinivibrio sp.]
MAFGRKLYPSLEQFNPIKVFPETAFPFVSLISLKILYPLTNDFVGSLNIGYALLYSFVIIVFLFTLEKTIKFMKDNITIKSIQINKNEQLENKFLVFLVFVLMFALGPDYTYLFKESNVNCLFHYSIPAILNISLVLFLISNSFKEKQLMVFDNYVLNGFFIVLLYIAIFSNLFQNIVLTSYCATTIALNLIKFFFIKQKDLISRKKRKNILVFLTDNYQYIVYIIVWGVACLYEANGMRASQTVQNVLTLNEILNSIKVFLFQVIPYSNISKLTPILCFVILSNGICFYHFLKKMLNYSDINFLINQIKFVFIFLGIVSFYILSTIKTGHGYLFRESLTLCWSIWIILICLLSFIYLCCLCNFVKLILPIYFCAVFIILCTRGPVFYEFNILPDEDLTTIKEFDNYVVEQFIQADKNNDDKLILLVPKFTKYNTNDNFPFATYANGFISSCLHDYGITKNFINVTIIPDESINKKFKFISE